MALRGITHGFAWEFLLSVKQYRPGQKLKGLNKSCSCTQKKFFGWGVQILWIYLASKTKSSIYLASKSKSMQHFEL